MISTRVEMARQRVRRKGRVKAEIVETHTKTMVAMVNSRFMSCPYSLYTLD